MSRRLAAVLLAGLVAGCGGEARQDESVLRFGLAVAPKHLDPRFASDATSERINRLLYRRLVEFDEQGLPVPGLASWEVLSPTHYRFRLGQEGREFTDGSRLTSTDVAATYAYILDPCNASPHRAQFAMIERIATPSPDVVDFMLTTPDPLFPAYLAEGILPASAIAARKDLTTHPIGSGSFRLLDWPEPGRLRFERRADGLVLEMVAVKDPNVRVMKLLRGEVQMLQNDLAPELVDYLAAHPGVRVETRPGRNFSYLGFNLEDPVTGRLAVRQALAHALDRESLLRHLFRGRGRTAETIFPPTHWAGAPGLEPYVFDPHKARALLASAGYGPGHPLRLTMKTSTDPFRIRVATAMQAQLAKAGIELSIRSFDWGTFFGDIKAGRFQLYGLTWIGVHTPDIFRYAFHSVSVPPKGANRGRYRDAEVDRLIEEAAAEPELKDQAKRYRQLQARLHRELPYLPLWYESQVLITRAEVEGYALAADGNYDGLEHVRLAPKTGVRPK